jgi:hypothetical protein
LLIKKAIATRQKEFLQEELVKIAGNYVQSQQQGAS